MGAVEHSTGRRAAIPICGAQTGAHLLAGLAAVLSRRADRHQLTLGLAGAGAAAPQWVAIDLSDDPSFSTLVARVQGALAAEAAPNAATEPPDGVIGLDVDPRDAPGHAIWVEARSREDGVELALWTGDDSGCEDATVGLLDQLCTLLEGAVAASEEPISSLPLLGAVELERLLASWNDTTAPYPQRCLHELLHEQARRTPQREAVSCAGQTLSFEQLDRRANQLAHHLRTLGVGPEVLVGIAVERSVDMLVGLLGILNAGGAYVPVDPAYPTERQEFMLQSSEAPVVLTQEQLVAGLPLDGVEVVCLDRDWPQIATRPAEPPALDTSPDQLAYVIYTSGSTGKPKGVQIPHRALVNFLVTMAQTPGLTERDVLVAVTTLSFDIAGLELYLPLLVGAQLVIATARTAADPHALAELLRSSGATVMQATPTTWRMLLDSGWTADRGLKALCGGEPLPVALADRLVGLGVELWNMYGPTETTIWSTCTRVTTQGKSLTIGRPIANTTLYILDEHNRPVPVGVAGELWIGGEGLARGYRGRADLTQDRFISHPFDSSEGARIYRTGDLARYRADGAVEFLGRIDNQVKVRGFRIELGEIETVLSRHTGIREAVVVARAVDGAEAELAAYVIPTSEPVGARDLREFAARALPAYMVPATVTTLKAFPLTPNGKVDRKALPEPSRERSSHHELIAPRTPLEHRLAEIWTRELGISAIGVTDDFFDLGVSSIVAATLFAAIEHELGGQLPLGAIFRAPTIEALAALIEQGSKQSRWTSLVPIQPEGSQPPIFCVHGGAGTILHLGPLARHLGPDQPFYALQSRGLYGGAAPLRTVEQMATFYLSEMRDVHPGGPWRLAGYCFGTLVAFELARMLTAQGEEVELLAFFNGPSPSWIKQYGWYGGQPSYRKQHALPPRPTAEQRKRDRRLRQVSTVLTLLRRIPRALRNPRRIANSFLWYGRRPVTRVLLMLGRPVPERLREAFFLELHAEAELAYDPPPYAGQILVFYADGLYDDPALGWTDLAAGPLQTFGVPGEHQNNRQAMAEPAVSFIADHLERYLERHADAGAPEAVADTARQDALLDTRTHP
jgi:amino acid adenylation domain-containing protein